MKLEVLDVGRLGAILGACLLLFSTMVTATPRQIAGTAPVIDGDTWWLAVSCDMLAPNLIALVAAGTVAGLLMHWRLPRAPGVAWLAGYGVAGYWGANPACMAGAFADVDPLVHEVWLANVMESYSIARFAVASPTVAISYVVVVALGVLAAIWQARQSR